MHFGYPYIHQGDTPDPKFGAGRSPDDYTPPAINLGPHVAPLGIEFYTGTMFPAEYTNHAFIAEHGSWNRRQKIGYRIKRVFFDENGLATGQEVFAKGWLEDQTNWGRPVDFETMLAESDAISIHIHMLPENYHIFNADAFRKMKKGAVLVNTSRGDRSSLPANDRISPTRRSGT